MVRDLSSQPDAAAFRSTIVLIVILICIGLFLSFTSDLADQAERISHNQVLTHIDYSLAMTVYDYTIKGKTRALGKFDRENPFVFVAIYRSLPENYLGTVENLSSSQDSGWYFELKKRRAVYVWSDGRQTFYYLNYRRDGAEGQEHLVLSESPDKLQSKVKKTYGAQ